MHSQIACQTHSNQDLNDRTNDKIAGDFGNPHPQQCSKGYQGVALTLIDSLSTLAVMGNKTEFEKGVWYVAHQVRYTTWQTEPH